MKLLKINKTRFSDIHLAKRFRTKRTGEEEAELSSEEDEPQPDVKVESVKTEQRNKTGRNLILMKYRERCLLDRD